jgi:hypothetical protein
VLVGVTGTGLFNALWMRGGGLGVQLFPFGIHPTGGTEFAACIRNGPGRCTLMGLDMLVWAGGVGARLRPWVQQGCLLQRCHHITPTQRMLALTRQECLLAFVCRYAEWISQRLFLLERCPRRFRHPPLVSHFSPTFWQQAHLAAVCTANRTLDPLLTGLVLVRVKICPALT